MNLFLTVGSQMPFDRLIRTVDAWAAQQPESIKVFGQIGPLTPANYRPANFEWVDLLAPDAFGERFANASHVIAHAGMGTIISALVASKPIALLPRRGALRETRNDHQVDTIRRFAGRLGIWSAEDERAFPDVLDGMLASGVLPNEAASKVADPKLTDVIRDQIMA